MNDLEQTQDFANGANVDSSNLSVTFLSVAKHERDFSNLSGLFEESTRELLRGRLIVATTTALAFLVAIKIVSCAMSGITLSDLPLRLTAVIVLAIASIYLVKHPNVSLGRLRIIEIVVFAIPVAEALMVLVQEVQKRVLNGGTDEISALFALICFAIAIIIAIYGMYIPTNWKRTLVLTIAAAVAPTVVALIHQSFIAVTIENYPGFAAPLMTLTMAVVATQAAHVVRTVRRNAAAAKLYGQYHLEQEIGKGGMGVVYRAKHRMLKRPAAIKLIRTEVAKNPASVREFEHEVQLSASLTHWNTVQIYDYGCTNDGEFYYVMEYLEGLTLQQRIRRGKLSPEETVHIVGQVCDGLAEAHGVGMIHRDIKPANLFLTEVGNQKDVVKILDFGLAAMKSEMTRLKRASGTPAYMSPEQIQGRQIDSRSDIYALGLVIYECLAGERLMLANSIEELIQMQLHQVPSLQMLPDSSSRFVDVIEKCINKSPNNRFKNVGAVKNAMQQIV